MLLLYARALIADVPNPDVLKTQEIVSVDEKINPPTPAAI